jgi:3-methyl-2-oxobutanoate hydroxymethyltransferase
VLIFLVEAWISREETETERLLMSRITVADLATMKSSSQRIVMTTAYDATMAALVDRHVDVILVGDSLGMVVQGHEDTLQVNLDHVVYHAAAVKRGSSQAHLVADLPFMSYQLSTKQALESAGRLLREGGAQSVKIEGAGKGVLKAVERMVEVGIPVMGHVGLTPQSVNATGGFKVQGRDADGAERIVREARALERAGVYAVVLEMIPRDLALEVTASLNIPTIGIGAGEGCDGQVLVSTDLLGLNPDFKPRFVERFENLAERVDAAMGRFAAAVRHGSFPRKEHSYNAMKLSVVESPYSAPRPIEREMSR